MKRNIITINEEKCNGCGLCVNACQEGALKIVNGKAKLISESYCDGLGHCLPECPTGAITIEEREAQPFDEEAVKANMAKNSGEEIKNTAEKSEKNTTLACGCPGIRSKSIQRKKTNKPIIEKDTNQITEKPESQLRQWPCQIKLVSPYAPYFNNAHLLVAVDCTAYAYANIHEEFMRNKITIIGCPKLDSMDYSEKLTEILRHNEIKSVTVLRMEVPCCGGIVQAVKNALIASGKMIPWSIVTISTDGEI